MNDDHRPEHDPGPELDGDDRAARDHGHEGRARSSARGFSTRAIRAASRAPRVDQRPTSVPIYQTATFASTDAGELGDVLGDPHGGYAYSRIANPTAMALGAAYAEIGRASCRERVSECV